SVWFQGSLEWKTRLRVSSHWQIYRVSSVIFDVGACRIEMRVVWNCDAGTARDRKQNALGCAPLVRGNDMAKPSEVLNHVLEPIETVAARVGFVAAHQRRPLLGRHRAGS